MTSSSRWLICVFLVSRSGAWPVVLTDLWDTWPCTKINCTHFHYFRNSRFTECSCKNVDVVGKWKMIQENAWLQWHHVVWIFLRLSGSKTNSSPMLLLFRCSVPDCTQFFESKVLFLRENTSYIYRIVWNPIRFLRNEDWGFYRTPSREQSTRRDNVSRPAHAAWYRLLVRQCFM